MRSGTIFRTTGVTFTETTMPTEAVSTDVTDIAMPELELDDDDVPNGGAQAANALLWSLKGRAAVRKAQGRLGPHAAGRL